MTALLASILHKRSNVAGTTLSLMHFDGPNGSTSFVDQVAANAWTAQGAVISTAQSKFGGSSASFASGYFDGPNSEAFAFPGMLTIECWVYLTGSVPGGTVTNLFQVGGGSNHGGLAFGILGNALRLSAPFVVNLYQGSSTIPLNTWTHCAVTRDASNVLRGFLNGVQDPTSTTNATNVTPQSLTGSYMSVGGGRPDAQVLTLPGYMDELRITKGACLYTGNFTPPNAPFSG